MKKMNGGKNKMKRTVSILALLAMVLSMVLPSFAANVNFGTDTASGEVPLAYVHGGSTNLMTVNGGTVSYDFSAATPSNVSSVWPRAVYHAGATLKEGFEVEISGIQWDTVNQSGVLIVVEESSNPGIGQCTTDSLLCLVDCTGTVYVWGGAAPNHSYGKWCVFAAQSTTAVSAGATSFTYEVKPDDDFSDYTVSVNGVEIYTYQVGVTSTGRFFDTAAAGTGAFNFGFQTVKANGNPFKGNDAAVSAVTSGNISFTVDSIEVICGHTQKETMYQKDATAQNTGYTGDVVCANCGEVFEEGQIIPAKGISVETTWGEMLFTYEGTWNPETLSYDYAWKASDNNVIIKNNSDIDLSANIAFTNGAEGIITTLTADGAVVEGGVLSLPANTQSEVSLGIEGAIDAFDSTKTIGNLNITINAPMLDDLSGPVKVMTLSGYDIREYVVVKDAAAAASVVNAANHLQHYIKEATGVTLPIVSKAEGKPAIKLDTKNYADDESFVIKTDANGIVISGSPVRGILYGTYTFLEEYVGWSFLNNGVDYFTAVEALTLDSVYYSYNPYFEYRAALWVPNSQEYYAVKQLSNSTIDKKGEAYVGEPMAIYGEASHTIGTLLGLDSTTTQTPCLYDETNYQTILNSVLGIIANDPDLEIVTVTQNDASFCSCENCSGTAIGGNYADGLLGFINRLAGDVALQYPNVEILTLAYGQSKEIPLVRVPADNVIIQLATISCCFNHALSDESCAKNAAFMQLLEGWSELCAEGNLYVWDYSTNFRYYYAAVPNFDVLRANIATFYEYGVNGVFSQGNPHNVDGEFGTLRYFLIMQVLANPLMTEAEYDALIDTFLEGYYGAGWQNIRAYLDFLVACGDKSGCFGVYATPEGMYYEEDFVTEKATLDGYFAAAAEAVAGDEALAIRVENLRLSYLYLSYMFNYDEDDVGSDYSILQNSTQKALRAQFEELFNALAERGIRVQDVHVNLDANEDSASVKQHHPRDWGNGHVFETVGDDGFSLS